MISYFSFHALLNPAPLAGLLAAGLAQPLGNAAGIINAVLIVAAFAGLAAAIIASMSERHTGMIGPSLTIAAVAGLAWLIVSSFFTAGGQQSNIQLGQVQ